MHVVDTVLYYIYSGANGGADGVVAVTGAANTADDGQKPPPKRGGNYSNHVSVTQCLLQVIHESYPRGL